MIILLKKLILLYTALLALMSPKMGASLETKLGATTYTKVPSEIKTITGTFAIFRFKNDTEIKEVPATLAEYQDASQRYIYPKLEGYQYVGGYAGETYATTTPVLLDNQYYLIPDAASSTPDAQIMIKLPNKQPKIIYLNTLTQ